MLEVLKRCLGKADRGCRTYRCFLTTSSLCSYMVLFLKFIASVVPTIEYDYTLSAGGS